MSLTFKECQYQKCLFRFSTKTEVEEIDPLSDLEDTNESKEISTVSA